VKVIYSDAHIIVVDKAHGEHSQPPAGQSVDPCVLTQCQRLFDEHVRIVHRLDRDASGLMVLARTSSTAGILGKALQQHDVERVYRARVGVLLPLDMSGSIRLNMKWAGGRAWVDPNGVPAVTHWTVVAHVEHASELEVRLETGRMHQIRVHLAARIAPILGDKKYRGVNADNLFLRAVRLKFNHPHRGEPITFDVSGF